MIAARRKHTAWTFDTFSPLGLNGETVQDWSTDDMIFSVAQIIAFLSRSNTLPAGTPRGVGMASKPPRWLKPGDEVSIEINGIGRLTNPVVQEA